MNSNTKIVLILTVENGIEPESIVDTMNAEILCRLEEDDHVISTWEWIHP